MRRDRTSLEVKGSNVEAANTSISQVPSPSDFGLSGLKPPAAASASFQHNPSNGSSTLQNMLPFQRAKQSGDVRRKVFLANFDGESSNQIPTATAYLKLTLEKCNVVDVSQLSKEYLNMEGDLVIIDTNGFEILDNPSTSGRCKSAFHEFLSDILELVADRMEIHGVKAKQMTLRHCTWDKFGELLAESGGRSLELFDELMSFFSTMNMYSSHKMQVSDTREYQDFLQLFTRKAKTRETGNKVKINVNFKGEV